MFKCESYIDSDGKSVGYINEDGDIIENENAILWDQIHFINLPQNEKCKECKLLPICQGGCVRLRIEGKNEREYT